MSQSALARRVATERAIARRIIKDAIANECYVSVNDGGEWVVKKSMDFKTIFAGLFSTDEDTLLLRDGETGERIGFVHLVYGNDGWDVMSDYTDTPAMQTILEGAHALADRRERRAA